MESKLDEALSAAVALEEELNERQKETAEGVMRAIHKQVKEQV